MLESKVLTYTMTNEKNYITPAGFKKLQDEYLELKHNERPRIVDTVAWAASNGDRSENADYIYGKKRLREIDRRLGFLTKQIDSAEVVDPTKIRADTVLFGATVTIVDEQGAKKTYAIVGADESDPEAGKISWVSPLGQALFKAKKGDFVSFKSPQGERDVEIIKISYLEVK